jgi:16S rRNA (guanine(966)-N(2))-methyltransferase RsmD
MRIIAGEFRSRTLEAPAGLATRPTSDRLRETLFNVLAPRIEGAAFLDLYAGSGAVGIEALSRGAAGVDFVERAPAALAALRANLARLGLTAGFAIHAVSVGAWLRRFEPGAATSRKGRRAGERKQEPQPPLAPAFDLVFLDPPYDAEQEYASTLGILGRLAGAQLAGELPAGGLLRSGAQVIAEHGRQGGRKDQLEDRYGALVRMRMLEQGDAVLSFYAAGSVAGDA